MKSFPLKSLLLSVVLLSGCTIDWTGLLSSDHTRPDPNPPHVVPAAEFRMLVVEETGQRPGLPASQQSIFTSVPLRAYLKQHAAKLSDGSNGFRFVDVDDVANLPAAFSEVAKQHPPQSLPWLYCTGGKEGVSCPLPASVDELMAKIKPYAEGGK